MESDQQEESNHRETPRLGYDNSTLQDIELTESQNLGDITLNPSNMFQTQNDLTMRELSSQQDSEHPQNFEDSPMNRHSNQINTNSNFLQKQFKTRDTRMTKTKKRTKLNENSYLNVKQFKNLR
jgi:hypothetical protein